MRSTKPPKLPGDQWVWGMWVILVAVFRFITRIAQTPRGFLAAPHSTPQTPKSSKTLKANRTYKTPAVTNDKESYIVPRLFMTSTKIIKVEMTDRRQTTTVRDNFLR